MKAASSEPRSGAVPVTTVTKTKTGIKVFAATTSNQENAVTKVRSEKQCVAFKDSRSLWRCSVFWPKAPIERTKLAAGSELCFPCLNEGHSFRQCPQSKNAPKTDVAVLILLCYTGPTEFFHRNVQVTPKRLKVVKQQNQSEKSWQWKLRHAFRSRPQSLLQTEVELTSLSSSVKNLALNSGCSHSLNARRLANKLRVKGSAT